MRRLIPHPVLTVWLLVLWLMLTKFSFGYLILGSALALGAGWAYTSLHPTRPRVRRWRVIPALLLKLFWDIICSNWHIARLLLTEGRNGRQSEFLRIPLKVRDENALALLATMLTATPGTAWLEYGTESGILTLHIFDASQADHYRDIIGNTYEPLLQEIFE